MTAKPPPITSPLGKDYTSILCVESRLRDPTVQLPFPASGQRQEKWGEWCCRLAPRASPLPWTEDSQDSGLKTGGDWWRFLLQATQTRCAREGARPLLACQAHIKGKDHVKTPCPPRTSHRNGLSGPGQSLCLAINSAALRLSPRTYGQFCAAFSGLASAGFSE